MDKKDYYFFGIAMMALSIASGLCNNILYLAVGGSLFTLEPFGGWLVVNMIVATSTALILLKYYHHRKYTLVFWMAGLSATVNLCMQLLFYSILSGQRALQPYYGVVVFFSLVTGGAYGFALLFSRASQRVWLKRGGFFTVVIAGILLILVCITIFSTDIQWRVTAQKLTEWVVLLGSVVPFLLILNFRDEIKKWKNEDTHIVLPRNAVNVLGLVCLAMFVVAIGYGFALSRESSKHLYWQSKNAAETEKFVQRSEQRSFRNAKGETLKYLLLRPKDYDAGTTYPLVVCLPYHTYECPPAQWLASDGNQYNYPAFIFVPFCPEGAGWGGIPNYPTIDTLVFDAITDLEAHEAGIDVTRRYVTGVSRGAYGSWHFITMRPDMFAAAIPVSGEGDPQLAEGITGVSVWAFHGALDRNVPVSGSRNMIDAMKKAGGSPKYTEFPDKAHSIWYEVTQTRGVCKWLFEQKRNSLTTMK